MGPNKGDANYHGDRAVVLCGMPSTMGRKIHYIVDTNKLTMLEVSPLEFASRARGTAGLWFQFVISLSPVKWAKHLEDVLMNCVS